MDTATIAQMGLTVTHISWTFFLIPCVRLCSPFTRSGLRILTKAFQNPRIPMYTEQNYLALINAWLGWIINFGYLNEKIIEEENAHKIQQDNVTVEMSPLGSGNFGSVWKVNFYDNWQC